MIIEPIIGNLDIEKIESNYSILGSLKIPPGKIVFSDTLNVADAMNFKNELSIDTPFIWATEIVATNEMITIFEDNTDAKMLMFVNVRDNVKWHEVNTIFLTLNITCKLKL